VSALVNSGTEEVLTGNRLIDEVIVYNRGIKNQPLHRKYANELSFLRMIRSKRFDLAIDLTSGDRAAILSLVSGARYRLAYDPAGEGLPGKRYVYTHLAHRNTGLHMVLQNLDLVRQFGIWTGNPTVDIAIPEDARAFATDVLKEHSVSGSDMIIHVHPSSRWLFKCWQDEFMADIISRLIKKKVKVIVTSSPAAREMEMTSRVLALVEGRDRLIDLSGRTSLKQLAALLAEADLFLGVDSAPMHIAAAVGTPVVALFGPTKTAQWGPWDNEAARLQESVANVTSPYSRNLGLQTFGVHTAIQRDWNCVPCGGDGCDGSKKSKCLDDIQPKEVMSCIDTVLERKR
jgi:heptosyltransferase-3